MHWTPLSGATFKTIVARLKTSISEQRNRKRGKRKPTRIQPRLEVLEQRETPAVATDVVSTMLPDAQITTGEVVRYRVLAEIPSGNNVNSLAINATLPPGLSYLNDGSTRIALVSDGGIESSLAPAGSELYVRGNATDVASVTPTFALPANAITATPDGVSFASDVTRVTESDAGRDYILIEFDALVGDTATAPAAGKFTGNFELLINGQPQGAAVGQDLGVVQPSLTRQTKTATLNADGSTTFALTFSNAVGPNGTRAYNVRVLDAAPDDTTLDPASVVVTGGTGVTNRSNDGALDVTLDAIAPGGSVTISYTVATAESAGGGGPVSAIRMTDVANAPGANSISGLVFGDSDESGAFNAGDALLANVEIQLIDETTGETFSTFTGIDGTYSFTNFADGTYTLRQPTQPAGWLDGNEFSGSAGGIADVSPPGDAIRGISLTGGVNAVGYVFGECPCPPPPPPPASISGFVKCENPPFFVHGPNDDGVGIANVTIRLLDGAGNLIATTLTDFNGFFQFTDLAPGTYRVEEVQPTGAIDSFDLAGTVNGQTRGVVGPNQGIGTDFIDGIVLNSGDNSINNCFFEVCDTAQLSGFVYCDVNGNGQRDAGETGLAGVTVQLVNTGTGATFQTVTDATGAFSFTNLAAGTYQVSEVASTLPPTIPGPNGQPQTVTNTFRNRAGTVNGATRGVAVPGQDVIDTITLGIGENSTNNSFGEDCKPAMGRISGSVYSDLNLNNIRDGNDPGEANVRIVIRQTGTVSATGQVIIPPPGGITPQAVGDEFVVFTDANGNFSLDVAPGVYQIVEDASTLPGTILIDGQPAQVFNAFHNMAGTVNGQTRGVAVPGQDVIDGIVIFAGDNDINNTFGEECYPLNSSISGFVYCDDNNNGVRDPGETAIPGVTMRLTRGPDPITGTANFTAVTDANGFFQFNNMIFGDYVLVEDASTLPPTVNGLRVQNIFNNRAGTVNGQTRGVAVPGQDVIRTIHLNSNENDINNNFGERCSAISGISISGFVFCTEQTRFVPVPGVSIRLVNAGTGEIVGTVATAGDGSFVFADGQNVSLQAGVTYRIVELPPPRTFTDATGTHTIFGDGADVPGTVNGQTRGFVVVNDQIDGIVLNANDADVNNLFFERCTPSKQDLLASSNTFPLNTAPTPAPAAVAAAQVFATSPVFASGVSAQAAGDPRYLATAADAGALPAVRIFDFASGTEKFNFLAYDSSFRGGVRVATGDVNGDGVPDIITAPGAGGGPHVKVFDGATGRLEISFMAYAPTFTGGVYVAAGDVNGDGKADIITGAGEGGGPHVRVFDGATGRELASFFAFAPTFGGGVRVSAGDFNGDGRADVVTAAGPGGGPHVQVYDLNAAITNAAAGLDVLRSFMAYNPLFRGGVYVAAGDVNGDGRADLLTGAGGAGSHVRVFSGTTFGELAGYMAFDPSLSPNGVRVGAVDVDGDGKDDIIAGSGPGAGDFVRVISGATGKDLQFFQAFDPTVLGGTFVA